MNKYIDFHVHETIKISGKVPDEVFKTIYEHSIANNRVSMDSIKSSWFKYIWQWLWNKRYQYYLPIN